MGGADSFLAALLDTVVPEVAQPVPETGPDDGDRGHPDGRVEVPEVIGVDLTVTSARVRGRMVTGRTYERRRASGSLPS
jgi:hypothetical protein